ncbi:hypothetical protein HZH68_007149 [Vespula germanica]|uniref:Uncharacterized protein n=1 Tax=Vespula germanica TaxID=30212 RepID=A0A834NAU1_VESGE|nr:hypothetical protein HZH68_007149 [Vespula germanica]
MKSKLVAGYRTRPLRASRENSWLLVSISVVVVRNKSVNRAGRKTHTSKSEPSVPSGCSKDAAGHTLEAGAELESRTSVSVGFSAVVKALELFLLPQLLLRAVPDDDRIHFRH